jgi:hypothetical protein
MSDEKHILTVDEIPSPAGHGVSFHEAACKIFGEPKLVETPGLDYVEKNDIWHELFLLEKRVEKIEKFLDIQDEK